MPAAIHREAFQLHRRSSGNYVGQRLNTEKPEKNSGFYFVLRKTNVEPSALAAETLRNKSDCAIWLMSDRSPLRLPQDLSRDLGVLSAHIHAVMYTL